MNPVSMQRRNGVVSVVAALLAVGVFWLIFLPRTEAYKSRKLKADLKKTLQAIQPPAGAKPININNLDFGPGAYAIGSYLSNSKIETLRAHYMQEFNRHGFVFKVEDNTETQTILHFCRPDYDADIVFGKSETQPVVYMIGLYPRGKAC